MTSPGTGILIKMGLELIHKVHSGAIETIFDDQNQPLFKRTDLGKCLGIKDIKQNFKDFPSHYTCPRPVLGVGGSGPLPWEDKKF